MNRITTPASLIAVAALALALVGCAAPATEQPGAPAPAADALSITDSWAKAADEGMTAAFGILENSGDTDLNVVSVTSDVSPMIELHETVESATGEMIMQPKTGGFVVPAGGSFELAPGGNHIMIMGITSPMLAGQEATFVLTLSDGSTFTFTAPIKDYDGANETYVPSGEMDMGGDQ